MYWLSLNNQLNGHLQFLICRMGSMQDYCKDAEPSGTDTPVNGSSGETASVVQAQTTPRPLWEAESAPRPPWRGAESRTLARVKDMIAWQEQCWVFTAEESECRHPFFVGRGPRSRGAAGGRKDSGRTCRGGGRQSSHPLLPPGPSLNTKRSPELAVHAVQPAPRGTGSKQIRICGAFAPLSALLRQVVVPAETRRLTRPFQFGKQSHGVADEVLHKLFD
ncbi:Protein-Associating With The Carboxyl-Terminal Domain Of Ezrin [Manis pentadactyla]|nr:Protein-Associating With The Carboxyl-Terminal Domain Of Ezrin [Manis pentadactyla]